MEQNEIANIKPTVTEDVNIKTVKPKSSIVLSILLVISVLIITVLSAVVVIQQININREKEDNATIDCSTECADLQQTETPTVTPTKTPIVNPTDIGEFTTYHSDALKLSLTYPSKEVTLTEDPTNIDNGIRIAFNNDDQISIMIDSFKDIKDDYEPSERPQLTYMIDGSEITTYSALNGEEMEFDPETGQDGFYSEKPTCVVGYLLEFFMFDVADKATISLLYNEVNSDCPSDSYHKEPLAISKQQAKEIIESIKFD